MFFRAPQGRWHGCQLINTRARRSYRSRCRSRKICVAFSRMYEISHAACRHVSRKQMHTGTVHCALGRIAHGSNVSCPRAALTCAPCRCPPRRPPPTLGRRCTSRPSRARSELARGSRERTLSPRERQASECTESGVPTDVAKSLLFFNSEYTQLCKRISDASPDVSYRWLYLTNFFSGSILLHPPPPSSSISLSLVRAWVPTLYIFTK